MQSVGFNSVNTCQPHVCCMHIHTRSGFVGGLKAIELSCTARRVRRMYPSTRTPSLSTTYKRPKICTYIQLHECTRTVMQASSSNSMSLINALHVRSSLLTRSLDRTCPCHNTSEGWREPSTMGGGRSGSSCTRPPSASRTRTVSVTFHERALATTNLHTVLIHH